MIFPILETEGVVQLGDMTRLNASKSFVTKGSRPITKVEIKPYVGANFIDVTAASSADWYLDWVFDTAGATRTETATVQITAAGDPDALPDPIPDEVITKDVTFNLITEADDKLFSSDTDLIALEPDILKWVIDGRATFKNVHRAAQTKIIQTLDEMGIVDDEGHKLTKAAIVDVTEVNAWSRDLVLYLIFKGISNAKDDVFMQKAIYYASEVEKRKERAVLRLDLNGDGELEPKEAIIGGSADLVRR